MKKSKVIVICPGRGSYTRESMGFINKYGRNVKVIFLTRNIKNVIKSVLQREKDYGIQWIEKHYKNLDF